MYTINEQAAFPSVWKDGELVAEFFGNSETCKANVRKFVAADELLEALEEAMKVLTFHYPPCQEGSFLHKTLQKIIKTIAKAEGRDE